MSCRRSKNTKSIVRSIRFNPTVLELVKQEAAQRQTPFSEFVRQSVLSNLRYVKRQAMEAWATRKL
jgi:hypothetical protein